MDSPDDFAPLTEDDEPHPHDVHYLRRYFHEHERIAELRAKQLKIPAEELHAMLEGYRGVREAYLVMGLRQGMSAHDAECYALRETAGLMSTQVLEPLRVAANGLSRRMSNRPQVSGLTSVTERFWTPGM